MKEQLIIFTRYPEPGKTKTRLIPLLGEAGAAILQRQMTEETVKKAYNLCQTRDRSLIIAYTGGTEPLMQQWLGKNLIYQPQSNGDLGQRMFSAFMEGFKKQMTAVVTIGIDCPQLQENIIEQAFEVLTQQDLVLGPADDGGYYLIGLSRLLPELFTGLEWGTSTVLTKTQQIAQTLELKVTYLPILRDIDTPEDFLQWQQEQERERGGEEERMRG